MITAEEFLAHRALVVPDDSSTQTCQTDRALDVRVSASDKGTSDDFSTSEYRERRKSRGLGYSRRLHQGSDVEDPQDVDTCREAALRLLDAAARPSGALLDRLVEKGYSESTATEVVCRLTEVGLIDDEAYAESALRYCLSRMMGYRGAMTELVRKGVDRALAQRICDQARQEGAFEEAAWELGRHSARKTQGMDPQTRKRRLWAAGSRKGHDPAMLRDIAHELLDRHSDD